jgi:uncharacterized cupin superfamily protein
MADGWFVVNVADARAERHPLGATAVRFDSPGARFNEIGIGLRVLAPGQPASLYHHENVQEDFLVLAGECLAILDGEERRLRAWDFVHCPPGTNHAFVGAGAGPCAILMVGARGAGKEIRYVANELAARHGASPANDTSDPHAAYAPWGGEWAPAELEWPLRDSAAAPGSTRAPAPGREPAPE